MEPSPSLPLLVSLARPAHGASTRVQLGSQEVVLEAVRGAHTLLWTNGRQAKRFVLGLAAGGHLSLQLRAPQLPVRVVPRDLVSLVPGGRIAGYVHVSLVPTVVWHDERGDGHVVLRLPPDDQVAEWDEVTGHMLHGASPWYVRFPMRNGEPRAIVPLRIANRGSEVATPPSFDLTLRDDELVAMRGSIVAPPRRLKWLEQRWESDVRAEATGGVP